VEGERRWAIGERHGIFWSKYRAFDKACRHREYPVEFADMNRVGGSSL
jgi:hypothetical protein